LNVEGEVKVTKLGSVMFTLIAASIFMSVVVKVLDNPVVQVSNRTGECVQIIYKGLTYECTSLKGKEGYSVEMVK